MTRRRSALAALRYARRRLEDPDDITNRMVPFPRAVWEYYRVCRDCDTGPR